MDLEKIKKSWKSQGLLKDNRTIVHLLGTSSYKVHKLFNIPSTIVKEYVSGTEAMVLFEGTVNNDDIKDMVIDTYSQCRTVAANRWCCFKAV